MNAGTIFAFFALLIGTIFFLYAVKYYITLAMVLTFSRRASRNGNGYHKNGLVTQGNGNGNGNGNGSKKRGILYRLFGKGSNGNGTNHAKTGIGMTPEYEKINLKRQPFISIHIPFYNERHVANRILTACTSMDYENYEVVVVDDSTDETVSILEKWKQHPRVKIIHRTQREGYKGGALKVALEYMNPETEFIVIFDADFIPYPDTLWQFLKYFNLGVNGTNGHNGDNNIDNGKYKDSNIAAVQGYQWHVLNKNENWITRGIRAEFAGSYVVERPGTEVVGSMKLIAGSVYMIRADLLKKYGWGTSITEDFELTLRLYKEGFKILYTPYIQTPSECVSTIKRLIRQRMRWAEGHTHQIKKFFWKILFSSRLQKREKLEFLYLAPYYLQAALFLIGTLCWFIADAILRTPLPFWTALWGWCLVLTNMFALPLMNGVGLFLEESPQKDYLGLFSFVLLTYILVPFQAFASLKGLFEKEEGHWFRTPKTGVITDTFLRSRFRRFFETLFPGKAGEARKRLLLPYELNNSSANNNFDNFGVKKKNNRWLSKTVMVILLSLSVNLVIFARNVPVALANPDVNYLHSETSAVLGASTWQMQTAQPNLAANSTTIVQPAVSATGWFQFKPGTSNTTDEGSDNHSADKLGWVNDTVQGLGVYIPTGAWSYRYSVTSNSNCSTGVAYMHLNVYKIDSTGANYTYLWHQESATDMWTGAAFNETVNFSPDPGQLDYDDTQAYLYGEFFAHVTTGCSQTTASRRRITFIVEQATTNCQLTAETCPFIKHPTIVIPERAIFLLAIIPFLPLLVKKFQARRMRA